MVTSQKNTQFLLFELVEMDTIKPFVEIVGKPRIESYKLVANS